MPPTVWIGPIPGYAIDQFTRAGGLVAKECLRTDRYLEALLAHGSIAPSQRPRALGDIIFIAEGGCLARRAIWQTGEALRRPHRALPYVVRLDQWPPAALTQLEANRRLIEDFRQRYLPISAFSSAALGRQKGVKPMPGTSPHSAIAAVFRQPPPFRYSMALSNCGKSMDLTNREIATLIWLAIFFAWTLSNRTVRGALGGVICVMFRPARL